MTATGMSPEVRTVPVVYVLRLAHSHFFFFSFLSWTAENSGMLAFVHLFVSNAGTGAGISGMRSQENNNYTRMLA